MRLPVQILVVVLLGMMFMAGSCRRSNGDASASSTSARGGTSEPIGKHWIQDQRLRAVMADVSRRMREDYPAGLPEDPEQPMPTEVGRMLVNAGKLADGLAKASQRIPLAIEGNRTISDEDRAGFLEEARLLGKYAQELSAAAGAGRLEGAQRSLQGINATCIACHSKYRDISGELTAPKQALRGGAMAPIASTSLPPEASRISGSSTDE